MIKLEIMIVLGINTPNIPSLIKDNVSRSAVNVLITLNTWARFI